MMIPYVISSFLAVVVARWALFKIYQARNVSSDEDVEEKRLLAGLMDDTDDESAYSLLHAVYNRRIHGGDVGNDSIYDQERSGERYEGLTSKSDPYKTNKTKKI